ncbi:DUF6118 family protein [Sphingopyxis fribergensis]|uniref:DUF6118 family protein n=1 Tax=Sphingopyxis fribergensis TaxID=1515612 RepID=UPI00057D3C3D|nr:DUF6118 family protein [Sphingopyxis fribergensis]
MTENAPQPEPEPPPVEDAVEAIIRGIAGLRSSVDGFAKLQQEIHGRDYSSELGLIAERWEKAREAFNALKERPVLALTPEKIGHQIEISGRDGRSADHEAWRSAQQRLDDAARSIGTIVASARSAKQQNRWLATGIASAFVIAAIVGCSLPPLVDRAAPLEWRWPEKRAAAVLQRDAWSAGQHLMQTSEPDQWLRLMSAARFYKENEAEIAACARRAKKKSVRCEVDVPPPEPGNKTTA